MKQLTAFTLAGLLVGHLAYGQGTVYVSNLKQPTFTSENVASDRWFAAYFHTGNDLGGYELNSLQLLMGPASGNPSGFQVFIYSNNGGQPGIPLGSLTGPDPGAGGIFSFSATGIALASSASYYIVATASSPLIDGYYSWNRSTTAHYESSGGWFSTLGYYFSSDGTTWFADRNSPLQFAVTATPVPEPSALALFLCASILFLKLHG
jgi:hypothetical protein